MSAATGLSPDIRWFKTTFGPQMSRGVSGTLFDADMLTAIACQETGYLWRRLRRRFSSVERVTALCVGDVIDGRPDGTGRRAFPKTKADLLNWPKGADMFAIARADLEALAQLFDDFKSAARNPNKFCRGFGVFQYDLQFFKTDPDYFLQGRYRNFGDSLEKCINELKRDLVKLHWQNKPSLTDYEMACVAIVYNTGRFVPRLGLKQGHRNSEGVYYGEAVYDFLRLARTIHVGGPELAAAPGRAHLAISEPVSAAGPLYTVETRSSTLRLRSGPRVSRPVTGNVIAELPEGQVVRAVGGKVRGFLEVETNLGGAHFLAYAKAKFLSPASAGADIAALTPASAPPSSGVVAVYMPRRPGTVTKRTSNANAHSLNESGQPGRQGMTPQELREELAAIIDWLAVDRTLHKRYQPRSGLTFCNIYAHDFCHLGGIYLPRVWWNARAIADLMQGKQVEPLYGQTIDEVRANDLFRWLRDFGLDFGWRRSSSLDELQMEVNQGAIGVIVARRREDGRSGHIVLVVPETDEHRAQRDASGKVVAPLQSQAGATNFRYGRGRRDWWKGAQFAESAFWLHP
jgi:hypothetical protein